MSLLIGIHGKIGSGKNTAATLLKDIIHSTKPLEERSFAYALKKIVAVFTNTSIETQMTEQGKNTSILFSSIIGGSTECDTDKLVDHLMTYKYFSEMDRELFSMTLYKLIRELENKKTDQIGVYYTHGELQQIIGTRFRELFDNEIWVNLLFDDWDPKSSRWIITDVRFPNEKKIVKEKGGLCIKMVGDPNGVRSRSKRNLDHQSETALDHVVDEDWDYVAHNEIDNMQNLWNQMFEFVALNY